MKKKIFLFVFSLLGISLNAQQLYFIRATIDNNYEFYELPREQIIAYHPEQDTVLQVCKDFTVLLHRDYNRIRSIVYYPEYGYFCFKLNDFTTYGLNVNQTDTIIELVAQCPNGYKISPFHSMNIVNNHWAYRCTNSNAPNTDYSRIKGIDSSLSKYFDMSASDFKNLHLTGIVVQQMGLKPNDGQMYLPIVAGIENRPPFSVELPQKYWVDKKSYTVVFVNDNHKTLVLIKNVDPTKNEGCGHFYAALYNKDTNTWSDIELKGNAPVIMTYGHWLAGFVKDEHNWDTGYIPNKISPGKSERDKISMENSFDERAEGSFYCPGILYLFNTDTGKYIEWNTNQGDSEILLVQNENVYYRVFDEIYKVAIIKGESLGKPELLVKDNQMVPQIHWAFLGNEIKK